jgi:secreted trypsin-like serine protease
MASACKLCRSVGAEVVFESVEEYDAHIQEHLKTEEKFAEKPEGGAGADEDAFTGFDGIEETEQKIGD